MTANWSSICARKGIQLRSFLCRGEIMLRILLTIFLSNSGKPDSTHRAPSCQTPDFDILIQDELNHPSLIVANRKPHPYPVISLVHHLRCSELRPKWQNDIYRVVEKKYLQSVDGFIFNSKTTKSVVSSLIGNSKPSVIAYPPTDRFGESISEEEIKARASQNPFQNFIPRQYH